MFTGASTDRLRLRPAVLEDAEFFLRLMNEPPWRKYIREHDVRSIDAARQYIQDNIIRMYADHGMGLWVVELLPGTTPVGVCGLLQRETLQDPDLGFALLSDYWGQGYAYEAARAVLDFGVHTLQLKRIVAITNPDNSRSVRVLEKLGFRYEGSQGNPGQNEASLFGLNETDCHAQ